MLHLYIIKNIIQINLGVFMKNIRKGFTLIEFLVVVVILGVLTAIVIPTYNKTVKKSRVSDGLHVLDMLASAEDKYFIEHGKYAARLNQLKAPLADYKQETNFNDIHTTNFTYDKIYNQHCITAKSNTGADYTLVKNYKTKEKVSCYGADCEEISDYVPEISDLSALCPIDGSIPCDKTPEQCGTLHLWPDYCECKCLQSEYESCVNKGGKLNYSNCFCLTPSTPGTPVATHSTVCDTADMKPLKLIGQCAQDKQACDHDGNWYYTGISEWLAPTYNCETGTTDSTGCPTGEQRTCVNCQWSTCQPITSCVPATPPIEYVTTNNCQTYNQDCVLQSDGTYDWQKNGQVSWAQPTYNCETGTTDSTGCPPGEQKTCVNCQWSKCAIPSNCNPNNQLTGVGTRACTTGNGASERCGTQTTNKQTCDTYTGLWQWDFTNVPCLNLVPKPKEPPYYTTSDGCLKKQEEYVCKNPSKWTWEFSGWEGNWKATGTANFGLLGGLIPYNCSKDHGNIGLNGQPLNDNIWCEDCLQYKCPDNAVRNIHNKRCYKKSDKDFKVFTINNLYNHAVTSQLSDACITLYDCTNESTTIWENGETNCQDAPHYRACSRASNGLYIGGEANPCNAENKDICLDEKRSVEILEGSLPSDLEYCRTSLSPWKVATNVSIPPDNPIIYEAKFCGLTLFIPPVCEPYPVTTNVRACDRVSPVIIR